MTKPEDVNRIVLQFYEKPDTVLSQAVAELETLVSIEKEQMGPRTLGRGPAEVGWEIRPKDTHTDVKAR